MSNPAPAYDLVLFGATGFTGRLVAEYLARNAHGLALALAGRSRPRLEAVKQRLVAIQPSLSDLPLLIADSADPASLARVCAAARVVCTTVGPYSKHGRALVAACVQAGRDYCDLTGEVQFIRAMIDQHHAAAQRTGARIVHCCGFDSIPSDLGVLMLHNEARARGTTLRRVRFYMGEASGGVSGGTVASMLNLIEEARTDRSLLRLMRDPYALVPGGGGPDGPDQLGPGWDSQLHGFTAPFVMAAVNTRVVRRSNALLEYAYGRDFAYSEVTSFPATARGLLSGVGLSAAMLSGMFVMGSPLGPLVSRYLPQPGDGPSEAQRTRGHFRVRLIGDLHDGATIYGVVEGRSDPGYGETAKMLGESALCLARDPRQGPGGVLTPAVALGSRLIDRLRQAGMTFAVVPRLP